jgi:hypothetical protein
MKKQELSEHERAARASRVRELTENEHFVQAVKNVDDAYILAWRNAKTVEAREDIYRRMILLNEVVKDLRSTITDGAFAAERIRELEGQKGGLRKIWG